MLHRFNKQYVFGVLLLFYSIPPSARKQRHKSAGCEVCEPPTPFYGSYLIDVTSP